MLNTDRFEQALIRDGFRCAFTGLYDDILERYDLEEWNRLDQAHGPLLMTNTELAHILPQKINRNPSTEAKVCLTTLFLIMVYFTTLHLQLQYASSIWAVLGRFGNHAHIAEAFSGDHINQLSNVMTMSHDAHDRFDRLQIWLEEREVCILVTYMLPDNS